MVKGIHILNADGLFKENPVVLPDALPDVFAVFLKEINKDRRRIMALEREVERLRRRVL